MHCEHPWCLEWTDHGNIRQCKGIAHKGKYLPAKPIQIEVPVVCAWSELLYWRRALIASNSNTRERVVKRATRHMKLQLASAALMTTFLTEQNSHITIPRVQTSDIHATYA